MGRGDSHPCRVRMENLICGKFLLLFTPKYSVAFSRMVPSPPLVSYCTLLCHLSRSPCISQNNRGLPARDTPSIFPRGRIRHELPFRVLPATQRAASPLYMYGTYSVNTIGCPFCPTRFCAFPPCDSAYAKLGMISSALSSDSDDVTKLLNVSLDLITASTTPNATSNKIKDGQSGPGAKSSSTAVSKGGARMDGLKGGAAIADSERAVEVLSFLVSKTKVRPTSSSTYPV